MDNNDHSSNAMVQVNRNYTYSSRDDVHLCKKCIGNILEFIEISSKLIRIVLKLIQLLITAFKSMPVFVYLEMTVSKRQ